MTQQMSVIVYGAGYVGLVTATGLAAMGHVVTCIERDPARLAMLRAGIMPFHEPGLAPAVAEGVRAGRLTFSDPDDVAVKFATLAFVCVGTPPRPEDGRADTSLVFGCAGEAAARMRPGSVLVIKSTVPVGTGDRIASLVAGTGIEVASNPEFLREGEALHDIMHPDRIVVGAQTPTAHLALGRLYAPMTGQGVPLLAVERPTAELIKYAANCFLAIKVSYINEIANLCEQAGADVRDVARGIGLDHRIGTAFLRAGPGFGGSCFPKDLLALAGLAQDHGVPLRLVETALAVNEARKGEMVRRIAAAAGGTLRDRRIAILGLAFKAGTDDMRSAPALTIIPRLQAAGAVVRAHDPVAMDRARAVLPGVEMAQSPIHAVRDADVAVVLTEWSDYRAIDFAEIRKAMRGCVIVDLRNHLDPTTAADAGLVIEGLGRPTTMRKALSAA